MTLDEEWEELASGSFSEELNLGLRALVSPLYLP